MEKLKKFLREKFLGSVVTNRLSDLCEDSKSKCDQIKKWFRKERPKFIGSFDVIMDDLEVEDFLQQICDAIVGFYLNNKYSLSEQRFESELFESDIVFENQSEVLFVSVEKLGLVYNVLIVKFKN